MAIALIHLVTMELVPPLLGEMEVAGMTGLGVRMTVGVRLVGAQVVEGKVVNGEGTVAGAQGLVMQPAKVATLMAKTLTQNRTRSLTVVALCTAMRWGSGRRCLNGNSRTCDAYSLRSLR